jgi:hypothetical protein
MGVAGAVIAQAAVPAQAGGRRPIADALAQEG